MADTELTSRFGTMVFSEDVMRKRLPKDIYKRLSATIEDGAPLDLDVANAVAHAMKEWAIELGATHYAHWFQPLSGITSEKHDSFLEPNHDGTAITKFTGKALIQGEPDASSFPNGGLRATFEARGYTAWDPTSSGVHQGRGSLCIPTAFCGYNGEALDKKTPLLRSMKVLRHRRPSACWRCSARRRSASFPAWALEQEYFLIKKDAYRKRRDLVICGPHAVRRPAVQGPGARGALLRRHPPERVQVHEGARRRAVGARHPRQDQTQRGRPLPARAGPRVHRRSTTASTTTMLVMEKMKLVAARHRP